VAVTAAARKRVRKVRVTVGSLTRTLTAGQVASVRVALNATGKRLLRRLHRLPLTLTTSATGASGGRVVLATRRLTLRAPSTRRR
jgi:hypothetical protein